MQQYRNPLTHTHKWQCEIEVLELMLTISLYSTYTLEDFWKKVPERISEISEDNSEFYPRLYLHGDPWLVVHCNASDLILTGMMVGRQVLMMGWKRSGLMKSAKLRTNFILCWSNRRDIYILNNCEKVSFTWIQFMGNDLVVGSRFSYLATWHVAIGHLWNIGV